MSKIISEISPQSIREIASHIRAGKTLLYPTETVYGLGCDMFNVAAVEKFFALKGAETKSMLVLVIPLQCCTHNNRYSTARFAIIRNFFSRTSYNNFTRIRKYSTACYCKYRNNRCADSRLGILFATHQRISNAVNFHKCKYCRQRATAHNRRTSSIIF